MHEYRGCYQTRPADACAAMYDGVGTIGASMPDITSELTEACERRGHASIRNREGVKAKSDGSTQTRLFPQPQIT